MTAQRTAATSSALTPYAVGRIRRALLRWYDEHASPFPWRESRDPYAALVAAVCSQQTQMSRVLPLWERWMAAFPTLADAAAATPAEALRVWDGAGYPRRALALRAAAQRCLAEHGGGLPRDLDALLALPGVGPFTAGIVLSFGWGDDAIAVDTNVVRVLGRLAHGDLQPAKETPPAAVLATAERLLPRGHAARWTPALMDYGARVCTPRPRCDVCVVARWCAARPRFEAGERATPVRAQAAFEGSERQWRGRIMRHLRHASGPLRTSALLEAVASSPEEAATVRRLLAALCEEGMAWQRGDCCGLGDRPPQA